jgi:hypothetical protein
MNTKMECCSKNCIKILPMEFIKNFKHNILNMTEKEKGLCIKTMMNTCQKESKKNKLLFGFKLYPFGVVCKNTIIYLYDISKERFENISKNEIDAIIIFEKPTTKKLKNQIEIETPKIKNQIEIETPKIKKQIEIETQTEFKIKKQIEIETQTEFKIETEIIYDVNDLICPISYSLMYDPVIASDGHNYERKYIESWIKTNPQSPITRQKIKKICYKNSKLKSKINFLVKQFKKEFNDNTIIRTESILSLYIEWIILDSESEKSKTRKDSILFLYKFYEKRNETDKVIKLLKDSGNEKELLHFLKNNNMEKELNEFLIGECPLMKTYFELRNK